MMYRHMSDPSYLDLAYHYAERMSGCKKVAVGSIIKSSGGIISMGANRVIPDLCIGRGCLRVEKYGDDSKSHRNPEDCRAIHSEIDAITSAAKTESVQIARPYMSLGIHAKPVQEQSFLLVFVL